MQDSWQASYRALLDGGYGWPGVFLREGLLRPLSWGYGGGVRLRNKVFDLGFASAERPVGAYIASIGNIAVGGVGKTPTALLLAEAFQDTFQIALIARGYRSQIPHDRPLLISDGSGPRFSAHLCGDEPYLLAQRLLGALVIVGLDRVAAAHYAVELGATLILVDDGFQHRRLARDSDVVVIDGEDPLGGGHLLPRGLLREGAAALFRANFLVINRVRNFDHYESVKKQLLNYTNAPAIGTAIAVKGYGSSMGYSPKSLNGERVALFCGIGKPFSFQQMTLDLGANIVCSQFFGDHAPLTLPTLRPFLKCAIQSGAQWLLCTEKDAVKLLPIAENLPLPLIWPQIKLEIVAGHEEWLIWKEKVNASKKNFCLSPPSKFY